MQTATLLAVAPQPSPSLVQRVLQFPLIRIVLAVLFLMVPFLALQAAARYALDAKLLLRMAQLLAVGVGIAAYGWYVAKIEKRVPTEVALSGALQQYGVGLVVGIGMVCVSLGAIAALGGLQSLGWHAQPTVALPLLMHMTVGLIEEMLLRVIIFRVLQDWLGSALALLVSALLFALAHLGNDHMSALAFADLVAAGVFFAALFMLTGRLWLCAAVHAGWNFAQDGVFSLAVSGQSVYQGLFTTQLHGPDWLTGGAFGIEGSAVDLVLTTVASAVLLAIALRQGRWMAPAWRRRGS